MLLFTLAFSLFVLLNPIGNVPLFVSHLKNYSTRRKHAIIVRELVIALVIILFFMFVGQPILKLLSIDHHSVYIAGGTILFIIALHMVFPTKADETNNHKPLREPFIVPLAVPLIAGPGTLTAVMIYSAQISSFFILIAALLIAWVATALILFFSPSLATLLGKRGIVACERLMGLLLTIIAIQMFLNGVEKFFGMPDPSPLLQ